MKRRITRFISVALIGAMAAMMAGCGGTTQTQQSANEETLEVSDSSNQENTDSTDLSIGIVVKTATNAHFQAIAYGATLAGKDLGIKIYVDNTASEADVEGQVSKCEDLITRGVDALILAPNESDGVSNAVEAAHDAGIPFVTIDTVITNIWGDQEKEYIPNYISGDHVELAYSVAKAVFDELGGEGNVVILRGVDAASSSQERTEGYEKAVAEYDGINLVESQSANYDQDTANTVMSDILQAHPDVDAVLCCSDLMAVGACTALEENGKIVGKDGVLVAGLDGNVLALQSIQEGKMYATGYAWSILWGYLAVEQAYDLIQGKDVPEVTITPSDTVITAENVEKYLPVGEEIDQWMMGSEIDTVSDYMREFVKEGKSE